MHPSISIIIPARNEEQTIVEVLKRLQNTVTVPYEIIVVDDCSKDKTASLVREYAKNHRAVKLAPTVPPFTGFAHAIETGFKLAGSDVIVTVMADLCDDPTTIETMYEKMQQGYDIVCACRYMKGGSKVGGSKLQGFFSKIVCRSLHLLTGIPTKDITNGFKMYRANVLKHGAFRPKSGVEASMERTFQAYLSGARIIDVPTRWKGRIENGSTRKLLKRLPGYVRIYLWALARSFSPL